MTDALTSTQQNIMHFLRSYIKEIGYPPTVREVADGVRLKSASSVHHQLKVLETLGYIRRDLARPRGLVILDRPEKS
jgi:repressor LexA